MFEQLVAKNHDLIEQRRDVEISALWFSHVWNCGYKSRGPNVGRFNRGFFGRESQGRIRAKKRELGEAKNRRKLRNDEACHSQPRQPAEPHWRKSYQLLVAIKNHSDLFFAPPSPARLWVIEVSGIFRNSTISDVIPRFITIKLMPRFHRSVGNLSASFLIERNRDR